jgi:hypothetical protein
VDCLPQERELSSIKVLIMFIGDAIGLFFEKIGKFSTSFLGLCIAFLQ